MRNPSNGLTAEQAEVLFNLTNNGILTRIDERGRRCEDLYRTYVIPQRPAGAAA